MRRTSGWAAALTGVVAALSTPDLASGLPANINFSEIAPSGFSVVVPDAKVASDAWADVLGVPQAAIFQPQDVIYPPSVGADGAGATIALIPLANMTLTLHQPPPGNSYWRDLLNAHGPTLYRLSFAVHGMAAVTRYFEAKGAVLVLGDPETTPYVNINLWPEYGVALEINEKAPNPTQAAHATGLKMIQTGPMSAKTLDPAAFASNPVTAIAFVVPDLKAAVHDYADVWGIPEASAVYLPRPSDVPFERATLRFPNGLILELDQPRGGPSLWRDHLEKDGRSMVSVNFQVKSVRDEVAYLKSKGGALVLGGADQPYAYFDFTSKLGAIIEVHQ